MDPDTRNARRQVQGAINCRVSPTPCPAPQTVACAREVAGLIGLDEDACRSPLFAEVFTGNRGENGISPECPSASG